MAQRCIVRFVLCNRLGFYRKRVLIELCLYCMKQRTCCCSHKGWQQNSNRPHSQWCVGHLSPLPHTRHTWAVHYVFSWNKIIYTTSSRSTNAIAWMCASIALSKKFTWCLSCASDAYSSSFLLLATVRNYFTDAWHAESLVCDKKYIVIPRNNVFLTIVQIHDPNFLTSKIIKSEPKKSMKPRTAAILGSANPLKFRSES